MRVFSPARLANLRQFGFDLLVALGDLAVMELVQIVRLPQLEEMFGPPRSFQRQGNLVLAAMTSLIAQLGQLRRGRVRHRGWQR